MAARVSFPPLRLILTRSGKLADSQGLVWIVPNIRRNPAYEAATAAAAPYTARRALGARSRRTAPQIPHKDSRICIMPPRAPPPPRPRS